MPFGESSIVVTTMGARLGEKPRDARRIMGHRDATLERERPQLALAPERAVERRGVVGGSRCRARRHGSARRFDPVQQVVPSGCAVASASSSSATGRAPEAPQRTSIVAYVIRTCACQGRARMRSARRARARSAPRPRRGDRVASRARPGARRWVRRRPPADARSRSERRPAAGRRAAGKRTGRSSRRRHPLAASSMAVSQAELRSYLWR